MEEDTAGSFSADQLEELNVAQDYSPGFRVLMERVPSQEWLFVIRRDALQSPDETVEGLTQKMSGHLALLRELTSKTDYAKYEKTIRFYESLATFSKTPSSDNEKELKAQTQNLQGDNEYFELLAGVLGD
ncbi:MAG: hypothetical protein R3C11_00400 [Planctomycetaceae bacterium]